MTRRASVWKIKDGNPKPWVASVPARESAWVNTWHPTHADAITAADRAVNSAGKDTP